jgi:WD40 repeat protein
MNKLDDVGLPIPFLCQTFQQLPFKDLVHAALVCKAWNRIAQCDTLWKLFSQKSLGVTQCDPAFSWKEWYQLLFMKIYNYTQFHLIGRKILLIWEKSFCFDETTNYQHQKLQRGRLVISDDKQNVTCTHFHDKSPFIHFFTGSFDGSVKIWKINTHTGTFTHLQSLQKHKGMITGITSNENYLYSSSTDKTICVWLFNSKTQKYVWHQTLKIGAGHAVLRLGEEKGGVPFFTGGEHKVRLWKLSRGGNKYEPAKITQISNVLICKMLSKNHIGHCE